jgi:hypothetical protein
MNHSLCATAMLLLLSCEPKPGNPHLSAATLVTRTYAGSQLAHWNIRARAAGADCDVLTLNVNTVLDDSMVEAIHYGGGPYAVDQGGVQRLMRMHSFRGVLYTDSSGMQWRFGDVTTEERLTPCE